MEENGKKQGTYELFKTNPEMEVDGIVLDFGPFKIRIARAGGDNSKFQTLFSQRMRPHWKKQQNGTMAEEMANDILISCFADAVVLGWEGVTDEHGAPMSFSRANVVKLFNDLPELFRDVRDQATTWANFKVEELEEAAGN